MATRRCAVCFLAVGALFAWRPTYSQGKAVASEALEAALEAYVKTWNRHNVNAWAATLTEDIWYTEATDYYQRMKGKKAVIAFFGDLVKTSDVKWEIVSIKMMPAGTATVVLRQHSSCRRRATNTPVRSKARRIWSVGASRVANGRCSTSRQTKALRYRR
jgi:ketosteroid isomerase-like protein